MTDVLSEPLQGDMPTSARESVCGHTSRFFCSVVPLPTMFRQRALSQLAPKRSQIGASSALVGFDGFVDTIVTPVGLRRSAGENFTPISTLTELGQRILGAAGKSTNIELYPRTDKLGGNGPIMANALLAAGTR